MRRSSRPVAAGAGHYQGDLRSVIRRMRASASATAGWHCPGGAAGTRIADLARCPTADALGIPGHLVLDGQCPARAWQSPAGAAYRAVERCAGEDSSGGSIRNSCMVRVAGPHASRDRTGKSRQGLRLAPASHQSRAIETPACHERTLRRAAGRSQARHLVLPPPDWRRWTGARRNALRLLRRMQSSGAMRCACCARRALSECASSWNAVPLVHYR